MLGSLILFDSSTVIFYSSNTTILIDAGWNPLIIAKTILKL